MAGFLFWVLFLVWIAASGVLVLVVLIQSGKGGGLSGLVGAGTSLGDSLGATGAEKTLNRWTSYCAIAFVVVTILLVGLSQKVFRGSILDDVPETTAMETEVDAQPTSDTEAPAADGAPVAEAPLAGPPAAESAPAVEPPIQLPDTPVGPATEPAPGAGQPGTQ